MSPWPANPAESLAGTVISQDTLRRGVLCALPVGIAFWAAMAVAIWVL